MAKRVTDTLQNDFGDETLKPTITITVEPQAGQERAPATFEELIETARAKADEAAVMKHDAEFVALEAAAAYKEARAAWDALFEALKGLRAENAPGYEGSKLARLLNYIPAVDK